jgi:hypothetical protein
MDCYNASMKARLLFHQRIDYADGGIVEMTLWRVPAPVTIAICMARSPYTGSAQWNN